jgi:anthranilate/para-aminobenzoate synthase component I
MIVDLMRNDISRVAEAGSVKVENLFDIASFATVHHMDSTVTARLRESVSALDAVRACFPPGSMTGAPKISAMRLCAELEGMQRGVYSGALGWVSGDNRCDLSVVIRTLIVQGDAFEFQVGGGIVADSSPAAEWAETVTKALGILKALGLGADAMERL